MKFIDTWDFQPTTDLETYLKVFFDTTPILYPPGNNLTFMEGYVGYTVHRHEQFQTQLFIGQPNAVVPDHIHPNIDSFEVYISGMTFRHSGETVATPETTVPGKAIYVAHNDWHGGVAGPNGGCFLSVQKWLNNTKPTSVERDWDGETMGTIHQNLIIKQ